MKSIIFLVGPTAVGKTAVSIYLAKMLNADIISCDSMQVYKGMDIGTGKPASAQLRQVPHHMIDTLSPVRNFSVADFRKKALDCIKATEKKGRRVFFVGGTALYMRALIDGLFPSPPADRALRNRLLRQEKINGRGYLYKQLSTVDKNSAKLLHPNDTRRIIRALEVYTNTGIPISELKKKTKGLKSKYSIKVFCLNRNRKELYSLIEARVDCMFKRGLLAESRRLKVKRLSMTARQALGYKEVFDYLDGRITLKTAKELIKKNTRNFAKRQLSWFRNDERIEWVDIGKEKPKETAEILCKKFMK
jgi:tRNA dimethylallyltransferase